MLMLTFIMALVRAAALSAALVATASAPRVQSFAFQSASNRMITPNADGRNDEFVVNVSNPHFSDVTGSIYDLRGHFVANMTVTTVGPNGQLQWDGRSGGVIVRTGVYIYVIRSEDVTYRGAVVVVR